MRLFFPALAILLLAGCAGSSSPSRPPASTQTPAARAALVAPTVTPVPATTTPIPNRACQLFQSPDERAPFVQSASFVDGLHVFAFGYGLAQSGRINCAYLARSDDGGQTWARLPDRDLFLPSGEKPTDDVGSISGIAFATQFDGWLYGPGLWSTYDGGQTWRDDSAAFTNVLTVSVSGGAAWLFDQVPCGAYECLRVSQASAATDWRWSLLAAQPPAVSGAPRHPVLRITRPTATRALITALRGPDGAARIVFTDDAGATWQDLPSLPAGRGALFDIAALGAREIWLTFTNSPATIMQGKEIYHSSDAGQTWQLIADAGAGEPGKIDNLPLTGYLPRLTPVSSTTLFLSMGRSTLYASFDAGQTWAPVIDDYASRGGADSVRLLGFGDALHSLATSMSTRWVTADGGHTWTAVGLPR
ncbi:MAG: hypothetical protein C0506_11655 [Anaerolinea sp.]|nr:hypothetical protein [Anaerolinea sp.]